MTGAPSDLDRLELELRCVPGVVAVGLDQNEGSLVVQVVVLRTVASTDVRERIRRAITANVREPVDLEVVVDALTASA